MSRFTEKWINALTASGLSVVDHRGRLPSKRDWGRRDVADLRGVCWHHSAGSRTTVDALLPIARYHIGALGPVHLTRDGSGAPGIAYTFAVVGSGAVYVLNDLEAYTWSQKGANKTHIGGRWSSTRCAVSGDRGARSEPDSRRLRMSGWRFTWTACGVLAAG